MVNFRDANLQQGTPMPCVYTTTNLTADNQAVATASYTLIFLTSDNATATNRTFTLTASTIVGHRLTLIWNDGTNAGEIADTGIQKLSATWSPGQYDTLELMSDGTNWIELARSNN